MAARFGLAAGVLQSHAIATYWVAPANGLKEMTTSYVRIVNTNNEQYLLLENPVLPGLVLFDAW
jgi:hypothetical protein